MEKSFPEEREVSGDVPLAHQTSALLVGAECRLNSGMTVVEMATTVISLW